MGWWTFPNNDSITLGDEAFDATYDYLEKLSYLYENELQRKLKVDELQTLLSLALSINGDDTLFDNFAERRVVAVNIKTANRPKKQKYQVGDIFALPLGQGLYGFGRILNLEDGWQLVEIYAYRASSKTYTPAIIESGRLIPPVLISPKEVLENWYWQVIQPRLDDHPPIDIDSLVFAFGTPGRYQLIRVNEFKGHKQISDSEAKSLPKWSFLTVETIENKIREAFDKKQSNQYH